MDITRSRLAILEALQAAGATDNLAEAERKAFVDDGAHLDLSGLGMDSLARMEFCIALELSLGVTLLPAQLALLESTAAVERFILERLT